MIIAFLVFYRTYFGKLGDLPAPANWVYSGGVAIFRPSSGLWAIQGVTRTYFGRVNDIPIPTLYRGTDSDCDGLPDWWEEEYFSTLDYGPLYEYPDNDGCNNLEEYESGTNPTQRDCGLTPSPSPIPTPTPDYVEPVFPPSSSSWDTVPYIIITNETLKNVQGQINFQSLIFHRLAQGMRGGIVTIEEIDAEYDGIRPDEGVDLQTKIREFTYDSYYYWGTNYVLFGGDTDVVPPRLFCGLCCDPCCEFPADMYYACFEGTFDADTDGIYAEAGDDAAEIDKDYKIYIGRAFMCGTDNPDYCVCHGEPCPHYTEQLANFVRKTITYENSTSSYLQKVNLLAPWNYESSEATARDVAHSEELYDGYSDEYITLGFKSSSFFNVQTYHCPYGDSSYDYSNEMITNIDNGVHIINHIGHSTALGIYPEDSWEHFSNDQELFFAYTQGCHAGDFWHGPRTLLIRSMETPYGCFAGVANSHDGYAHEHQDYNREFWDALFGEGFNRLGQMLADSKYDNIGRSYHECAHYNQNLFGDPATQLHNGP